jgi:ABC superfamily ATP binding cassette transporter, ABC protein
MEEAMKVNDLYFAYDKEDIIKGVCFEIKRGKITTLMGANGCGKSTLFQLMTKNLKPRLGNVTLDEKDINTTKLKEFARNVAIVHQYNKAPSDLLIENLISYGRLPFLNHLQQPREEDKNIVQWALEVVNLKELRKRPMGQLSGGQRQRAWIGMSLAQKPKILFLDEPTTYLDVKYQIEILRLIKHLNEKYDMTIVMVLHDINQAIHYSDEIIGMKNGNILFQGNPNEVITEESIQEMYGIHLDVEHFKEQKYVLAV